MPRKKTKTYFCYILQCRDGSLYTGSTDDLQKREVTHNNGGGSKYVHSHGGGTIIYSERFTTRSEALQREAAIKKLSREGKKKLIARL